MDRKTHTMVADLVGHFLTGYAARQRRQELDPDDPSERRIRRQIRWGLIVGLAWAIGYLLAGRRR